MIKRIIMITLITFALLLNINASEGREVVFDEVNTLNFVAKTQDFSIEQIFKICSYDFCDYVKSSSKKESIKIFQNAYLSNIQDMDLIASLKVKGIRITKIILY